MTPEVEPLQRLRTGLGHEGGRELQLFDFFFFFFTNKTLFVYMLLVSSTFWKHPCISLFLKI